MPDPRVARLRAAAGDLERLASQLTAVMADVAGAAGPVTWQGPAADTLRCSIGVQQQALSDTVRALRQAACRAETEVASALAAAPAGWLGPEAS